MIDDPPLTEEERELTEEQRELTEEDREAIRRIERLADLLDEDPPDLGDVIDGLDDDE